MASFFSFKRRRAASSEELELGSSDSSDATAAEIALAPDTPPSASESHLLAETSPTTQQRSGGTKATTALPRQRQETSENTTTAFISKPKQQQDSSSTPSPSSFPASSSSPLQEEDSTSKVRARAAYFEALIRSRAGRGGDEASLLPASFPVDSDESDDTAVMAGSPFSSGTVLSPKPSPPLALGGITAAAAADALENLRIELERIEEERARALNALRRKAQEVDNLQSVVRQLSESRVVAMQARAQLAEQCVDLKRSHDRVARVADLSRAVSRENMEMTKTARDAAAAAEREAGAARREAAAAAKAELKAAADNERLRQRVAYLERCPVAQAESVCRRELISTRVVETY